MSTRVQSYVETFEQLRKIREGEGSGVAAIEDVLEDRLDDLWNELTVDEVQEVYRRYPELRIRRLA
jgi:hypothetical protein